MIVTILLFIISLGVLIFIHELGHFLMAKAFNVYVKEFALGFGPTLLKFKRGETQYAIRALPLGGYVAMVGEEASEEDIEVPKERSLMGIKKGPRALIMSAGVILNFVLAFILFFISNIAFIQNEFRNDLSITPNSPAALAGITSSDETTIVGVDFKLIEEGNITANIMSKTETYFVRYTFFHSYKDELIDGLTFSYLDGETMIDYVPTMVADEITFDLPLLLHTVASEEDPQKTSKTLTLKTVMENEKIVIENSGINLVYQFRHTFTSALKESGAQWVEGATLIAKSIIGLFVGKGLDQVGGIVAIFDTTATVYKNLGLGAYVQMWGLISVNLALFNLLPFPGLDGWHLLVIGVEAITKKEIPQKVKGIASFIGLVLLLGLMVLLLIKDIFALF